MNANRRQYFMIFAWNACGSLQKYVAIDLISRPDRRLRISSSTASLDDASAIAVHSGG
jgi:hypothetical protein